MSQVIQLLPDSVANQIAAGEVIQRPASVVKELVENAIDAGATDIQIVIKDAGRTLVQIIDNGVGMSAIDIRMAFERHATSKIREANDLFALQTMGFRGEALPSIASVAQVEVKSCYKDDELVIYLEISGSQVIKQESIHCSKGTNISVKNLFFNIPVRRKFLKSNSVEYRHILTEFERIVLANPEVSFVLMHNDLPTFTLPASNLRQRVANLMGKGVNSGLVPIDVDTDLIKVSGYIGSPDVARKLVGDQYFFVNNRFMKHPYFHKAVLEGYQKLLPPDLYPIYFIYLYIDPQAIDVNIHPTKTEIKFEDERSIWHIIAAGVKESLGKFSIVPSIDFDAEPGLEIPVRHDPFNIQQPTEGVNPAYNPFDFELPEKSTTFKSSANSGGGSLGSIKSSGRDFSQSSLGGFDHFASSFGQLQSDETPQELSFSSSISQQGALNLDDESDEQTFGTTLQLKRKYILTTLRNGLVMIDQKRAQTRILYERFLEQQRSLAFNCQKLLYPQLFPFSPTDSLIMQELIPSLMRFGIEVVDCGSCHFKVTGLPVELEDIDAIHLFEAILDHVKEGELSLDEKFNEMLASKMALSTSQVSNKELDVLAQKELVSALFACSNPNYTPDGKSIFVNITYDEIAKRLS